MTGKKIHGSTRLKNPVHKNLITLGLVGVLLSSCTIVENRLERAAEVPQIATAGVASQIMSEPVKAKVLDDILLVWKDEQKKVRNESLRKLQLLDWAKERIEAAHKEYLLKKELKGIKPDFSQTDFDNFKASKAYNQAAFDVAGAIISSKEYRLKNLDSLSYLLGAKPVEEAISIVQIGLEFDLLSEGSSSFIVTENNFLNSSGDTVQLIQVEKKQTSGVNLLDDIMNKADGSVSYTEMKAKGISDTEITAFSAFVRYFSMQNLPIIGQGDPNLGHKRKIYAALWAAVSATTLPVTPDGRLLTPPNGMQVKVLDNGSPFCDQSNPIKDKNGINFLVCPLQVRSPDNQVLDSSLRIVQDTTTQTLGGGAEDDSAARAYTKMVLGIDQDSTSSSSSRRSVEFKYSFDPVASAADFEKSDSEIYKTAIKQLGSDGWFSIMALTEGAVIRGGSIGAIMGEVWPLFTPGEGFALGVATEAINTAFNMWIRKEKLSQTQIAESIAVIKALTAQVGDAGIIQNKFPAMWVIIPEGQTDLNGNPVEAGVRLVRQNDLLENVTDAISKNQALNTAEVNNLVVQLKAKIGSLIELKFTDVSGRKMEEQASFVATDDSGTSLQSVLQSSQAQSSELSSRYSPEKINFLMDLYGNKNVNGLVQHLIKKHVDEQVHYNYLANEKNFRSYMSQIMTALVSGKFEKIKTIFQKEFGITYDEFMHAENLENLDLETIAFHSPSFQGNVIGLKTYFESVKGFDLIKDQFFDQTRSLYKEVSESRIRSTQKRFSPNGRRD